jgi:acyl-coenzyme A thioesterase PaaI-like protein
MNNERFGRLIRRVNWYPPFLGMGIRVRSYRDDFTRFEVELRPRWFNRNLFGTHFGGSLYAMADPFFVFIVAMNLGKRYIVWDKAASIDFLKPAEGTILGIFEISRERLDEMRSEVDAEGKKTFDFDLDLTNESGEAVARVSKKVYVRSKSTKPGQRERTNPA